MQIILNNFILILYTTSVSHAIHFRAIVAQEVVEDQMGRQDLKAIQDNPGLRGQVVNVVHRVWKGLGDILGPSVHRVLMENQEFQGLPEKEDRRYLQFIIIFS